MKAQRTESRVIFALSSPIRVTTARYLDWYGRGVTRPTDPRLGRVRVNGGQSGVHRTHLSAHARWARPYVRTAVNLQYACPCAKTSNRPGERADRAA